MTVSGLTMVSAERQPRQRRDRQITTGGQPRSISGVLQQLSEHTDLVTQSQVLELEGGTRSKDRRQSREECHKSSEHRRNYERNSHPFRYFEVFGRHRSEQNSFIQMGCEARKLPAAGEIFFLTSAFIELIRTWDVASAIYITSNLLLVAFQQGSCRRLQYRRAL
jgi:hypothetical protein